MSPFFEGLLSGMFIGVIIGVFFIALMQASKTNYCTENEGRVRKGEKAVDTLDPVLSATRIKECL